MTNKKEKLPSKIIKEMDIHDEIDIEKEFEIVPRIEPHQIKLPVPRQLSRDLGKSKEKE